MSSHLSHWFFERQDPRTAAALRIAFCFTYLLVLWDFAPAMNLLFGAHGLFGTMEPLAYDLSGWRTLLYRFDDPFSLQVWLWLSVAVAFSGLIGFRSRLSLALVFYSMLLFRERGPYITFGADLVLNCLGVWLLFADTGAVWSVDRWRKSRRGLPAPLLIENWPVKALQIQVALIYLITGLKKLQTTPWQDGSAVYYALHVGNVLKGGDPSWVTHHHALMAALNYFTLLMEIGFTFLVFNRKTRLLALLSGIALHTGIDALMSIRFFSLAMYVGYLSFLTQSDWTAAATLWDRFRIPRPMLWSPETRLRPQTSDGRQSVT
jgi:hypothetical protein